MRNKLLIVLVLSIFGVNALADGHEKPFSVFIGISTDNQSAMVGAWDTFMASECGQSLPGQVSIMNEFFNGDHPSTHTLVIGYPNQQAWAQGLTNNRCVEWSQLMRSTSTLGKPEWQNLGMSVLSGGDLSKDGAYTIYQMNITDEGKYAAAFEDLIKGLMKAGQKITSYGLVRIVGGAQSDVGTHFAYVGAANGLDQLDNVANSDEKSLQKFRSKVSSIRTVNRTNMNFVAKRY